SGKSEIFDGLKLGQLDFAEAKLTLWCVELFASACRMKGNRGLSVQRHVDLAHSFISIEIAIDTCKSHCFLRVSQLDADKFFRRVQHVFGDAWRRCRRW